MSSTPISPPRRRLGYIADPPHRRTQRLSHEEFGRSPAPPLSASLERFEPLILDQGQTGSCVGHGTAMCESISSTAAGKPLGFVPSPRANYAIARTLGRSSSSVPLDDGGAMPSDMARGADLFGCRPMQGPTPDGRNSDVWGPDDAPAPNVNLEEDLGDLLVAGQKLAFQVLRIDETQPNFLGQIQAAIAAGWAVGIGIFVDQAFFDMKTSLTSVDFADPNGGGHWICLDAYSGSTYSGPNSWGLGWGMGPLASPATCLNKTGHWRAEKSWLAAQAGQGMDVYAFRVVPTVKGVAP